MLFILCICKSPGTVLLLSMNYLNIFIPQLFTLMYIRVSDSSISIVEILYLTFPFSRIYNILPSCLCGKIEVKTLLCDAVCRFEYSKTNDEKKEDNISNNMTSDGYIIIYIILTYRKIKILPIFNKNYYLLI